MSDAELIVENLDKVVADAVWLDKNTRKTIERLAGEIKRWRSLGKDLVQGAALAALPEKHAKEVGELKAALESALKQLDDVMMCPKCSACEHGP